MGKTTTTPAADAIPVFGKAPAADPEAGTSDSGLPPSVENAADPAPVVATVPMVRDAEHYPPPHTADVHPDEVENWSIEGWVKA